MFLGTCDVARLEQVVTDAHVQGGPQFLRAAWLQAAHHFLGCQSVGARVPFGDPVLQRLHIAIAVFNQRIGVGVGDLEGIGVH